MIVLTTMPKITAFEVFRDEAGTLAVLELTQVAYAGDVKYELRWKFPCDIDGTVDLSGSPFEDGQQDAWTLAGYELP